MHLFLTSALIGLLAQAANPGVRELAFQTPDGTTLLYALSVPRGYDPQRPAPLVLVLHPGGERTRYYGSAFMRFVVEPALSDLRPIMIAPDCPTNAWTDPGAAPGSWPLTIAIYSPGRSPWPHQLATTRSRRWRPCPLT